MKPDFAAPGVSITGAGLNGGFVVRSGSSAATGLAAGAVALMLGWFEQQPGARGASTSQIRNLIVLGAKQRPEMDYPNEEWGYGTLDLYRLLDTLRQL